MNGLCLIAGQGRLPEILAAAHPGTHIAAMEGYFPDFLAVRTPFRIETLGSFLAGLRAEGVTRLCLAGAIRRPAIDPARIDAATAPLVPRLMQALRRGDDGALRVVLEIVEEAGFAVLAPQDLLPELLPPAGALAGPAPSARLQEDARHAREVLRTTGPADIGQGCVVAAGQVLAMEALPGTDWMLASMAAARGQGPLAADLPSGGVFAKAPKPDQDRRVDLPAIGPETVAGAVRAGLDGIVLEAGGVLVLDRDACRAAADAAGLALWAAP